MHREEGERKEIEEEWFYTECFMWCDHHDHQHIRRVERMWNSVAAAAVGSESSKEPREMAKDRLKWIKESESQWIGDSVSTTANKCCIAEWREERIKKSHIHREGTELTLHFLSTSLNLSKPGVKSIIIFTASSLKAFLSWLSDFWFLLRFS